MEAGLGEIMDVVKAMKIKRRSTSITSNNLLSGIDTVEEEVEEDDVRF